MQLEYRGTDVLDHLLQVIHRRGEALLHIRHVCPRDGALQRQISDDEESPD